MAARDHFTEATWVLVQLRERARRILTDGLQHEPAAVAWAVAMAQGAPTVIELFMSGFTARELSLGATAW